MIIQTYLSCFYDISRLEARSSYTQRTIASGTSFLQGLLETDSTPEISIDDHLLKFYEDCTKFQVEVADNPDTYEESRKLEASEAWAAMETNIRVKTGVLMSSDFRVLAWDICRYERAWTYLVDSNYPAWCSLFSNQDLDIFAFNEDLKYYYDNGRAFPITTKMTQPLFQVSKFFI